MSNFPKYFTVQDGASYKLYLNTLYKSPEMRTQTNVVWPIDNIRVNRLTIKLFESGFEESTIRKWNSSVAASCNWTFTGSSVEVYLVDNSIYVNAPLINMSSEDKKKLPYNSRSFVPSSEVFLDEYDTTIYISAKIYRTDPSNTTPVPDRNVPDNIPVARVVAMAPLATAALSVAAPLSKKGLPSHITKIVLADSIRKNECCPITSEPITESNATVTSCGHVFCSDAIAQWLATPSSKGLCPMCKQVC